MRDALASGFRHLVHAYEAVQVEQRGSYSVERALQLDEYASSCSWAWCVAVLLATPLPCLVTTVVVDAVPMHPASDGLAMSHLFWWRVALISGCVTFTLLEQLHVFVPRLPNFTLKSTVVMSVLVRCTCTAYSVLFAFYVGFPLPFTLYFGSPPWQVLFWGCVLVKWGRELRADSTLRSEFVAFYKVVLVQLSLGAIYPARPSRSLPVLKVLAKNSFHWVFRHAEDFRPEVVIFNVEIFHALFVGACMQSSTSLSTNAAIMAADAVQAWVHLHDIDAILSRLQRLHAKRNSNTHTDVSLLKFALAYVAVDPTLQTDPQIRLRRYAGSLVGRELQATMLSRDERREYVATVLRVLHFAECLVLIEFVEVIVPLVYSVYILAISQMPNRAYNPQLAHLDHGALWRTVGNVLSYTALELLSLVGLCVGMQRKLHISPVHQLVFVLHRQWKLVQSKLVLWVLVVVEMSFEQFGCDYTFQFAWLRASGAD